MGVKSVNLKCFNVKPDCTPTPRLNHSRAGSIPSPLKGEGIEPFKVTSRYDGNKKARLRGLKIAS